MDIDRLFVTPHFCPDLRANLTKAITAVEGASSVRFPPLLAFTMEVPKNLGDHLRDQYTAAAKAQGLPHCIMVSKFTFPFYNPGKAYVALLYPMDPSAFLVLTQSQGGDGEEILLALHRNWARLYQSPLLSLLGSEEN